MLGSINLSEFVTTDRGFDFSEFIKSVKIAVNALNDVLDEGLPLHPLQIQRDTVRDYRQIGLGIFGLADMLIKMRIKYGSQESLNICNKIGFVMANTAIMQSAILAKEFGAFPMCDIESVVSSNYFENNTEDETKKMVCQYGLRNSQILTIAPTGSTIQGQYKLL